MRKKTITFNKIGINKLPNNKPVVGDVVAYYAKLLTELRCKVSNFTDTLVLLYITSVQKVLRLAT